MFHSFVMSCFEGVSGVKAAWCVRFPRIALPVSSASESESESDESLLTESEASSTEAACVMETGRYDEKVWPI